MQPAVDRARAGRACATARCSRTSARPTCAFRSPTRSPIRTARGCPRGARLDLAAGLVARRSRRRTSTTFRCLALARAAGEAGGTRAVRPERRRRGGRRRLPRGPLLASSRSPRWSSARSTRSSRRPARGPRAGRAGRRRAPASRPPGAAAGGRAVSIPVAIGRPAAARVHPRARPLPRREGRRHAGHALLGRLRARAALAHARRHRVPACGAPARRLREDRRHGAPACRPISRTWGRPSTRPHARARHDRPDRLGPAYRRLLAALAAGDDRALKPLADELQAALEARRRPDRPRAPELVPARGHARRDDVDPRCYWRADVWRRVVVIAAGPFANILTAIVILTAFFWSGPPQFKVATKVDQVAARARPSRAACAAAT